MDLGAAPGGWTAVLATTCRYRYFFVVQQWRGERSKQTVSLDDEAGAGIVCIAPSLVSCMLDAMIRLQMVCFGCLLFLLNNGSLNRRWVATDS